MQNLGFGDQINGDVVLVQGDIGMPERCFDQGPLDFPAGGVFGVQDPPVAVSTFTRQVILVMIVAAELNAPVDQICHGLGAGFDNKLDDIRVGEIAACNHGVLDVGGKAVLVRKDCRNATLCQLRCSDVDITFGDQRYGAVISNLQGIGKPCDSGTDNQEICRYFHNLALTGQVLK